MNCKAVQILDGARSFVQNLTRTDRDLRRMGATVPSTEVKEQLAAHFWSMIASIDQFAQEYRGTPEEAAVCRECREIVGSWLFRSRYFNRSFHKPHGYAGDFHIVEWMYDLEGGSCADPTQPGIVNCLDYIFTTVHSVQSVWERRRQFAQILRRAYEENGKRLRILDVACGGSRYTADFLTAVEDAERLEITLVDQDPAAIAFCRMKSLKQWTSRLTTYCIPIRRLAETLTSGNFDVIIAAGLFDYLDETCGRGLVDHLI